MRKGPDRHLARALKRLREDRDVSQEQLALEAGITSSALSRIERGLTDPRWGTVMKLIAGLGVTVRHLLAELERR